jgi:hypothetical protein
MAEADWTFEGAVEAVGGMAGLHAAAIEVGRFLVPAWGVKNSHIYRAEFEKHCTTNGIQPQDRAAIVLMSGVINNVNRLMERLDVEVDFTRRIQVQQGLRTFRQYVDEPAARERFPFVNVNRSMPAVALIGWILAQEMDSHDRRVADDLFPPIMERPFVSQLDLSADAQARHMAWARIFWDEQVTKSKNPNQKAFKQGFQADFYATSRGDAYHLIPLEHVDMEGIEPPYTIQMLSMYQERVNAYYKNRPRAGANNV